MFDEFVNIIALSTPLLIGILAWLAKTWIKARLDDSLKQNTETILEEIRLRSSKQVALTESRVKAFSKLWEITKDLSPSGELKLEKKEMGAKLDELRSWYYEEGNAMHLSLYTTNDLLKGLQYLELEGSPENLDVIKKIFSSVRTRSKEDLGVYGSSDIAVQIPNYEIPLADGETIIKEPAKKA